MLALLGRRGAGLARAGRAPQHSAFALVRAIATGASHGLNVLFVGSDDFSADVLGRLEQYSRNKTTAIGVLEVLCQKPFVRFGDNAKVTRVPTHQIAANRGLQPHLYDTQGGFWWTVPQPKGEEAGRFDIGVVCTGAPTLPQAFVDGFPMGVVMVHPSLLPKYRGDNPIQSAILAGESETGVSVVEYSATHEFGGRLLAQVPHELDPGMMYADVKSGLAHLGGELLAKVLHNLDFVRSQAVEQDESKAVYTRPMEDCRSRKIVWESMSATDIFNIFRALPANEPLHTILPHNGKMERMNILELHLPSHLVPPLHPRLATSPPGSMFYNKKTPYIEVPCFDGSRIHIDRFLMDRKTPKTALEFVNGYLREQGASQMVTNPLPSKKGRRPAIPQVDPSAKSLYPPNHKFDPNPDPSEVKRANKARWTKRGGRGKAA